MPRISKKTIKNNLISDKYLSNGVIVTPEELEDAAGVKILYDGLLAKDGAKQVFAHVGFGESWSSVSDYIMKKNVVGFETIVPVKNTDKINICFKDDANNWDNNFGQNYVFPIK